MWRSVRRICMWLMGLKGLKNFLRKFDKIWSIFPLVIISLILIIYFLDDVLVLLRENWCWSIKGRVLKKSRQPAKFTGYLKWTRHLLFFGRKKKETPKSQNLMMSVHNFFPGPLSNLHFQHSQVVPLVQFFSFSAYSKALATYLKPHWKPWKG